MTREQDAVGMYHYIRHLADRQMTLCSSCGPALTDGGDEL